MLDFKTLRFGVAGESENGAKTCTSASLDMMNFSLLATIDGEEVVLEVQEEVQAFIDRARAWNEESPAEKFEVVVILNPLNDISKHTIEA